MSPKIFKILHDLQVKFVVTAHDYFLACPNGGFYNYSEGRHCNLKPLSLSVGNQIVIKEIMLSTFTGA